MPLRKYTLKQFGEWQQYFDGQASFGKPKWQIYKEIGERWDVHPYTVCDYFERDKRRAWGRESWKRRRQRLIEQMELDYRSRTDFSARTIYNRQYRRVTRHPERYIPRLVRGSEPVDLDHITDQIPRLTEGVRFWKRTVERIIEKYMNGLEKGRIRGPSIEEIEPGVYRRVKDAR